MKEIEVFLKTLSDGLKTLSKGIDSLSKKVDDLAKAEKKKVKKKPAAKAKPKKAAAKKAAPKKTAKKKAAPKKKTVAKKSASDATAFETVTGIITKSKTGVDTAELKKATGFDSKKLANIIYKAKKRGLIKAVGKGKYTGA